jgi:hypothetical protein
MIWDGPGRPVLVLLRAEDLTTIRTAVARSFPAARSPRFLTTVPISAARRV